MKKIISAFALILLASCATKVTSTELIGSDLEIYTQGMQQMHSKKYVKAINSFEELERQHPYSDYSKKGAVMIVYAQFKNEDFDESIASADRFIRTNIGHPQLDYVYYMKALNNYYRIEDVKRDQSYTKLALANFETLINKFPESKYSKSAKLKVILCYDHLAGKEMEIGRFYQNQESYLAAANRFQEVVNKYQKSSHTPEALYRVAEVYISLGLENEAVRSLSILGYNYTGESVWYKKGYDLIKNIDDHEEKFKNEKWYQNFSENIVGIFS